MKEILNEIGAAEFTEELAVTTGESKIDLEAFEVLLSAGKLRELKNELSALASADIAEIITELPNEYHAKLYRLLPKDTAAEVFVELDSEMQENIINSFTDKELSEVLSELYLDDTVDIIEEMPANVVKRILRASNTENRNTINRLLRYPKDSAGSIMTTEYVRFTAGMTVEAALAHIRKVAIDKETIYTCYVTDRERHLCGIVTAKELLISPLDMKLSELMTENVIYVGTGDDREEVALMFDKYGFLALPVVDAELRLVGIVTLDDAISVIKEEAEEDFSKMAAVTPTETPYLKTSALTLWRARIPWLLLLMVSATFSSMLLGVFEAALPAVLILFVPMLMGTGGNSGGQSSVTVTRAISTGELPFSALPRVLFKELRVGVYSGITLATASFLKLYLIDGLLLGNPEVTLLVSLIVSLALALTVISAKLVGALLPLLASKIGLDPAVMASPIMTTLLDIVSLAVYFLIASLFI